MFKRITTVLKATFLAVVFFSVTVGITASMFWLSGGRGEEGYFHMLARVYLPMALILGGGFLAVVAIMLTGIGCFWLFYRWCDR